MPGFLTAKSCLGALFVGIGPVEDLFFDELARRQRFERCSREVEIGFGRDGKELSFLLRKHAEVFVHIFQRDAVFELSFFLRNGFFLALKQFLRGLPPSTEVVFVKHDEVPIHRVEPFVPSFDISGRVAAQQILKGAKVDDRLVVVDFGGIAVGIAGEIVPAVKIDMGFEIGLPCVFHSRFEGQH